MTIFVLSFFINVHFSISNFQFRFMRVRESIVQNDGEGKEEIAGVGSRAVVNICAC